MNDISGINSILQLNFPIGLVLIVIFFAVMLSSYVKIVTILGIIRAGFGFHNIPTALITGGVALILSFFIMAPVISDSTKEIDTSLRDKKTITNADKITAFDRGSQKWKSFLVKHTHPEQINSFSILATKLDNSKNLQTEFDLRNNPEALSWRIIAPAFIVSELKEAFATGLSLFLPFFIIDLVVAAILTATELKTLSPSLVGLPIKLLLFVAVDGWSLITTNLISTYIR